MDWNDTPAVLIYLAGKSKGQKEITLSTSSISQEVGLSQQSVSRKLKEHEDKGWIIRKVRAQGIAITLTSPAVALLRHYQSTLNHHLNTKETTSIKGIVTAGLGEGKYYMSLEGYKAQFKEKLGYQPYEGTLNLTVQPIRLEEFLAALPSLHLEGFTTAQRTFGGLRAYPVTISVGSNKKAGHLITPERTVHTKAIAEVICPAYLRKLWKLENGTVVTLTHD